MVYPLSISALLYFPPVFSHQCVLYQCFYTYVFFTIDQLFAFIWFSFYLIYVPCHFYTSFVTSTFWVPLGSRSSGMRAIPGPAARGPLTALLKFILHWYRWNILSIGSLPLFPPLHLATIGSLSHTNDVITVQQLCITVSRSVFFETGYLYSCLPHSSLYGLVPVEYHCWGLSMDYIYHRRPEYCCLKVVEFERCWDRWVLTPERGSAQPLSTTVD